MSTNCALPSSESEQIVLGHGGGGKLSYELIHQIIGEELKEVLTLHDFDAGIVSWPNDFDLKSRSQNLVMTTDSFVVDPLFFAGGDIGKLSMVGTINDLAMMGAKPLALSLAFILEEGFLISDFRRILHSIKKVLSPLSLTITCGDTKVVPRGKGDKIFINTSGLGLGMDPLGIWTPHRIQVGDALILSRDIGRHGVALLTARQHLGLNTNIESDCHELLSLSQALIEAGVEVHCARDLTRGGLMAALVEISKTSNKFFEVQEESIPCSNEVKSFCEILGFDVLSMANEGAALYFVSKEHTQKFLSIAKTFTESQSAHVIGQVMGDSVKTEGDISGNGHCLLRLISGVTRRCVLPPGELLPRIC